MKTIFLIVVLFLVALLVIVNAEEISVSSTDAEYLHTIFYTTLEEAEKTVCIPEKLEVILEKIDFQVQEFKGYGIHTRTLVAIAYVKWKADGRENAFIVQETLRMVQGNDILNTAISLQDLEKIQRRIAEALTANLTAKF